MQTTTESEVRPAETDTSDPGRYAHYIKRRHVTDAYVFGKEVEALCGHRFVPTQDPEKKPVCPVCKQIFEDDSSREQIGKYLT